MEDFFSTPPATHLVYIPFILLIGAVLGFVVGRQAGIKAGEAEYLSSFDDEDDLLDD